MGCYNQGYQATLQSNSWSDSGLQVPKDWIYKHFIFICNMHKYMCIYIYMFYFISHISLCMFKEANFSELIRDHRATHCVQFIICTCIYICIIISYHIILHYIIYHYITLHYIISSSLSYNLLYYTIYYFILC